jgi:hypothetical protein
MRKRPAVSPGTAGRSTSRAETGASTLGRSVARGHECPCPRGSIRTARFLWSQIQDAIGGEADMACALRTCRSEAIDPNVWSGRALQENCDRDGGYAVLHQCIRPLIGAFVLRAIMGISARAISLAVRPQAGCSGHQCSHALGRPILHLISSPLADLGR